MYVTLSIKTQLMHLIVSQTYYFIMSHLETGINQLSHLTVVNVCNRKIGPFPRTVTNKET